MNKLIKNTPPASSLHPQLSTITPLTVAAVKEPEAVSQKIKAAFVSHANWLRSDNEMRELRKQITLAIYAHEGDLDKVTEIVDRLLALIQKAQKKSK